MLSASYLPELVMGKFAKCSPSYAVPRVGTDGINK